MMDREMLTKELCLVSRTKEFSNISDLIMHDGYVLRLQKRLKEFPIDPRVDEMMEAMKLYEPYIEMSSLRKRKEKMTELPLPVLDELYFVFQHAGIERVVDVLIMFY